MCCCVLQLHENNGNTSSISSTRTSNFSRNLPPCLLIQKKGYKYFFCFKKIFFYILSFLSHRTTFYLFICAGFYCLILFLKYEKSNSLIKLFAKKEKLLIYYTQKRKEVKRRQRKVRTLLLSKLEKEKGFELN